MRVKHIARTKKFCAGVAPLNLHIFVGVGWDLRKNICLIDITCA
jgi:hypothetical protein